jgi:hypothetical protein
MKRGPLVSLLISALVLPVATYASVAQALVDLFSAVQALVVRILGFMM